MIISVAWIWNLTSAKIVTQRRFLTTFFQNFFSLQEKEEKKIAAEISVMQPILRFLQLLCENHNRDLQVGGPTSATRSNSFFVGAMQ